MANDYDRQLREAHAIRDRRIKTRILDSKSKYYEDYDYPGEVAVASINPDSLGIRLTPPEEEVPYPTHHEVKWLKRGRPIGLFQGAQIVQYRKFPISMPSTDKWIDFACDNFPGSLVFRLDGFLDDEYLVYTPDRLEAIYKDRNSLLQDFNNLFFVILDGHQLPAFYFWHDVKLFGNPARGITNSHYARRGLRPRFGGSPDDDIEMLDGTFEGSPRREKRRPLQLASWFHTDRQYIVVGFLIDPDEVRTNRLTEEIEGKIRLHGLESMLKDYKGWEPENHDKLVQKLYSIPKVPPKRLNWDKEQRTCAEKIARMAATGVVEPLLQSDPWTRNDALTQAALRAMDETSDGDEDEDRTGADPRSLRRRSIPRTSFTYARGFPESEYTMPASSDEDVGVKRKARRVAGMDGADDVEEEANADQKYEQKFAPEWRIVGANNGKNALYDAPPSLREFLKAVSLVLDISNGDVFGAIRCWFLLGDVPAEYDISQKLLGDGEPEFGGLRKDWEGEDGLKNAINQGFPARKSVKVLVARDYVDRTILYSSASRLAWPLKWSDDFINDSELVGYFYSIAKYLLGKENIGKIENAVGLNVFNCFDNSWDTTYITKASMSEEQIVQILQSLQYHDIELFIPTADELDELKNDSEAIHNQDGITAAYLRSLMLFNGPSLERKLELEKLLKPFSGGCLIGTPVDDDNQDDEELDIEESGKTPADESYYGYGDSGEFASEYEEPGQEELGKESEQVDTEEGDLWISLLKERKLKADIKRLKEAIEIKKQGGYIKEPSKQQNESEHSSELNREEQKKKDKQEKMRKEREFLERATRQLSKEREEKEKKTDHEDWVKREIKAFELEEELKNKRREDLIQKEIGDNDPDLAKEIDEEDREQNLSDGYRTARNMAGIDFEKSASEKISRYPLNKSERVRKLMDELAKESQATGMKYLFTDEPPLPEGTIRKMPRRTDTDTEERLPGLYEDLWKNYKKSLRTEEAFWEREEAIRNPLSVKKLDTESDEELRKLEQAAPTLQQCTPEEKEKPWKIISELIAAGFLDFGPMGKEAGYAAPQVEDGNEINLSGDIPLPAPDPEDVPVGEEKLTPTSPRPAGYQLLTPPLTSVKKRPRRMTDPGTRFKEVGDSAGTNSHFRELPVVGMKRKSAGDHSTSAKRRRPAYMVDTSYRYRAPNSDTEPTTSDTDVVTLVENTRKRTATKDDAASDEASSATRRNRKRAKATDTSYRYLSPDVTSEESSPELRKPKWKGRTDEDLKAVYKIRNKRSPVEGDDMFTSFHELSDSDEDAYKFMEDELSEIDEDAYKLMEEDSPDFDEDTYKLMEDELPDFENDKDAASNQLLDEQERRESQVKPSKTVEWVTGINPKVVIPQPNQPTAPGRVTGTKPKVGIPRAERKRASRAIGANPKVVIPWAERLRARQSPVANVVANLDEDLPELFASSGARRRRSRGPSPSEGRAQDARRRSEAASDSSSALF
ncbi:hypothetical protein K490DRAFT_68739 [Saccharata proteae CBS 121410]|uniref:Uncharacterized protein n=1 Tax=Saccharata proteae CBS 121410 TaxID=1314787 RepID=A0A9P4HQ98_9PEZI|nr:hypothetical protein K490DRAFT_68739 [Saccharata proteae CBS 121410]